MLFNNSYQSFQGALPLAQTSSSTFLSRKVSIGCQKPVCLKALSSPPSARRCMGSLSQTVSSPLMYFITSGSRTKKPPLIQTPLSLGFSRKWAIFVSPFFKANAPNLPGDSTAVTVANVFCFLWNSMSPLILTSLTPSPYVIQNGSLPIYFSTFFKRPP